MAPILIIDPGHGGIDPGGGSNKLFTEKDLTLKISLYQFQRMHELNIPTAVTRTTDQTLSSEERTALVRNSGARYCISNHINAGGGRGSEVIYSIYASAALPRKISEALEAEGMPNRRIFTRTLPNDPSKDYYFMHRDTGCVETVIVEYGFADNPLDADKLNRDWRDLAEAVIRAFCEHTNLAYRPPEKTGSNPPPVVLPGNGEEPDWKREAIEWMYEQGLLTNEDWRNRADEPLPLWAEAVILRRLFEKMRG
ncbi:N-acetylmuramoyl-L-alanine amidase family protein [Brevibacillus sp. H7]|uniref:N-acetylmuramoyl-L-alanine amidase family protein n=1 Tax=Brevibacillus sp. H7 TaxID=3349138 RepID=UPI0037F3659B